MPWHTSLSNLRATLTAGHETGGRWIAGVVWLSSLLYAPSAAGALSRAAIQGEADPIAKAASAPLATRADMDTTTSPCQDFLQYATGGFYKHSESESAAGAGQIGLMRATSRPTKSSRHVITPIEAGLRQLVARSPALVAAGTTDPTLRVVGTFYGSCVRDTSGLATGSPADTGRDGSRALYCFDATRRHLERAMFELFMEHSWTAQARLETRRFWPLMRAAADARFEASSALSSTTKRYLKQITGRMAYLTRVKWDSTPPTPLQWGPDVRGPSDLPFMDRGTMATWNYRDYSTMTLSPTDFRQNVTRLEADPDPLAPPTLPVILSNSRANDPPYAGDPGEGSSSTFIGEVVNELDRSWSWNAFQGPAGGDWSLEYLGPLIPPFYLFPSVVDGQLDLGMWYGMTGYITGHEATHNWEDGAITSAPDSERTAFATEQFQGQMESYDHPFDDAFAIVIAHDAFQHAMQGRPQTKIDGFTPMQRFFLGIAWGGITGAKGDRYYQRGRVSVNGTLSTLPSFAQAFGCKAGDPMAGGRIWYRDKAP